MTYFVLGIGAVLVAAAMAHADAETPAIDQRQANQNNASTRESRKANSINVKLSDSTSGSSASTAWRTKRNPTAS